GALLVCFLALAFRAAVSTGGKRTVYFLLTIPVCITIYFTDTRSIWLAFAFVLALLAVTRSSMRATAVRVIALAALLFISGVGSKFSFFEQTLFGRRSETVDYRFVNMDTAINMFADNPVFGIGYGNFTRQWRRYFVDKYDTVPDLTDGNHSTLFGILAELGAIGIVLYSAILLGGLKAVVTLLRSLRDENRSFEKRFVLVTLGIWISFLVIGVTSDLRFHQLLNVVLFLFLGLVTSIATAFQQPSRRPEPTEP
ncbi:MAG TPA: O-antigen ligase family protein, partial [Terriglobia bacterium]|nr:O-antigen ligase family protein [Terriglobia bacterium]